MKKKTFLGVYVSVFFAIVLVAIILCVFSDFLQDDKASLDGAIRVTCSQTNRKEVVMSYSPIKREIDTPDAVTLDVNGFPTVEVKHHLRPIDIMSGEKMPKTLVNARKNGALAAITIQVIDVNGTPVPAAVIRGGFWNNGKYIGSFDQATDRKGLITLQSMCMGDVNFSITKGEHYETRLRYKFDKGYFDCVENGRWIPWDATVTVVLKEYRNPIPLYVRQIKVVFPKKETVGFDCRKGDLVEPFGKGTEADFYVWYESIRPPIRDGQKYPDFSCFTNNVTISIPNGGGFITLKKDKFSQFVAEYEAPDKGYITELNYGLKRTTDKVFINRRLDEKEYLFFRSRVGNGYANYGKIYRLGVGDSLEETNSVILYMSYYFNPTPNHRNLEFDGKNNLFKPDWTDTDWPREP